VTICTQDRACLFGDVAAGAMRLNEAGQMVTTLWDSIAARFSGVEIDRFVVMPNHLHGILVLPDGDPGGATEGATTDRATTRVAPTDGDPVGAPLVGARVRLGDVVGAFKS
jgi:putative transposase